MKKGTCHVWCDQFMKTVISWAESVLQSCSDAQTVSNWGDNRSRITTICVLSNYAKSRCQITSKFTDFDIGAHTQNVRSEISGQHFQSSIGSFEPHWRAHFRTVLITHNKATSRAIEWFEWTINNNNNRRESLLVYYCTPSTRGWYVPSRYTGQ